MRSEEILPARQGHKRVDTCGFHPLVDHPFPLEGLAKIGERRPLRKGGTAEDFFYRIFLNLFAVSDTVLLHRPENLRWARHSSAARFFCTLYRTAPANLDVWYKLSSQVLSITTCYRIVRHCYPPGDPLLPYGQFTLCRTQRRVARMCSSKLSVNCEKAEKDTLR